MTQAAYRAASVTLLTDYGAAAGIKLQVYPGRPRTIYPPTAFIDAMRETITFAGVELMQRVATAEVIVIHGLFDTKDATEQKDAFVDGFIALAATRYHEAGPNTLIAVTATEDLPAYVPDWLPPDQQRTYYATQITLEGYAES